MKSIIDTFPIPFEPSLEDIFSVVKVIRKKQRREDTDRFMLHLDELKPTQLERRSINIITDRLEQMYKVIVVASTPYDEDNGEDEYLGMTIEEILESFGLPKNTHPLPSIIDAIFSYGIVIEPGFELFYKKLKNADRTRPLLNPANQLPKSPTVRFESRTSSVIYKNEHLLIRGDKQVTICRVLFNKPNNVKSFNSIANELDIALPPDHLFKPIYDAINALNVKISSKYGLKDFIIKTHNKAWINKKYL